MIAAVFCALGFWARNRVEQHIRQKVVPSLSQRFGRSVEVGEIHFGLGSATVTNIRVSGPNDRAGSSLLRVNKAEVEVDLRSLLSGEVVVKHIAVKGVAANLHRATDGDNVSDLAKEVHPSFGGTGEREDVTEIGDGKG